MSTKKETEKLIESELNEIYFDGLSDDSETACRALNVWKKIWELMEREDNYSSEIGNIVESWVISNFVNDLTMLLNNTKMYDELIVVNEQILKIDWGNEEDTNLFHENAKRNIADAYADMNNIEKAYGGSIMQRP